MKDTLMLLLGYILIWWAVSIGREEDSKIEPFSINWIAQILLIAIGVSLICSLE